MPFFILYILVIFVVILLVIANVILPQVNPRYKSFWMFRRDKYSIINNKIKNVIETIELEELENTKNILLTKYKAKGKVAHGKNENSS